MPIVKHWRRSKWPSSRVKFSRPNNSNLSYIPAMIFSTCLGTLIDYLLINQGFYSFPLRPFPELFDVNIFFTIFILPGATFVFLFYAARVRPAQRLLMIVAIGAVMPGVEAITEKWGWFLHSDDWSHLYSLFGYVFYSWLIWSFHRWANRA